MNLEHRLQHAARELREVDVNIPPLGSIPAAAPNPTRRMAALVAPVLFVLGGLVMTTGALRHAPAATDTAATSAAAFAPDPIVAADATSGPAAATSGPAAATPGEELELIASLVADATRSPDRARPVLSPGPHGVV